MDSQNNQVVDNFKNVLHLISFSLSIMTYFEPNLAILSVLSTSVNAIYHAITTNNK